MIQLGLSNIGSLESVQELPPTVARALAEAVAWCSRDASAGYLLRSPELNPAADLFEEQFPGTKDGIKAWVKRRYKQYDCAVTNLVQSRSALLSSMELTATVDIRRDQGKLMAYFPLETVSCGAAEASSSGFFDGIDAPPWDTWFAYSEGRICCWVPNGFISRAQAGIDANPVDCIHWIHQWKLQQSISQNEPR
jgi:hypothetical protein